MTEEWRIIPSFSLYEASSAGRIRRGGTNRVRALHGNGRGYLKTSLWVRGEEFNCYVHRLVCEAFHGPAPIPKMDAAHANGVRDDNRPDNLRWATRSANNLDRRNTGTAPLGERNVLSKLTDDAVREIRKAYSEGPRSSGGKRVRKGVLAALSEKFGVAPSRITAVARGACWWHVS